MLMRVKLKGTEYKETNTVEEQVLSVISKLLGNLIFTLHLEWKETDLDIKAFQLHF